MDYIAKRKFFYLFSGLMIALSMGGLMIWGLNWGIDFTGGTFWEVSLSPLNDEHIEQVGAFLEKQDVGQVSIQKTGENNIIFRLSTINEEEHQQILRDLQKEFPSLQEKRFDSIGPSIGQELRKRSIWAVLLVFIGILLYLSYAFRHSSFRVPAYRYGSLAVLALLHDAAFVVGIFVFLGKFQGWEVNSDFIVALLVVAGYSVHDTIVVFDRIRENLVLKNKETLQSIINMSVSQTILRSLNTSLTTLFPLIALYLWGPVSIQVLVAAMIGGVIVGTYSSLFIAPTLLFDWERK